MGKKRGTRCYGHKCVGFCVESSKTSENILLGLYKPNPRTLRGLDFDHPKATIELDRGLAIDLIRALIVGLLDSEKEFSDD